MEIETQNQADVLHSENMEWLKKLVMYADEIKEMQSRIEEIAANNTSRTVMPRIEHFQNQLIIQKHRINSLKHSIKNNDRMLNTNSADSDHASEKDKIDTFERIIKDLHGELNEFLQQPI